MAHTTALKETETRFLQANGINPCNAGVLRRSNEGVWILKFQTRDTIAVSTAPGMAGDFNVRAADEFEAQIMWENDVDVSNVGILYRSSECISALNLLTRVVITIWKGDRKW